jgi:cation:H+ antiporter
LLTIIQFMAGFVVLLFGAEYLVRGAVSLARRLSVSPMIIGMTIVSYGTTAPELVVSLQAAVAGRPGIGVGNVIGSNIANILLILGASAAIFPIVVNPRALRRDAAMVGGSAILFTLFALSGMIERWQGALMVAVLIGFSFFAFHTERRRGRANDPGDLPEQVAEEFREAPKTVWLSSLSVVGGVASVTIGAKLLVTAAIDTARALGVGEEVIGLTIVAVGTSLPEFATAVVAALRKHPEVAVGNIVGANIYNLLAIMGLVAVIAPIPVPPQILVFDLWFMLVVTAALLSFLLLRGGLSRTAGAICLTVFIAYTALEYIGVEKALASIF